MSDISWLNPTPHAIAVYASQPLSPGATQHSLPSGRYSLLGPDFHRLDRTSLRLAHLFDHLIGAGEQHRRHINAEHLGSLEVNHQFILGRHLHWQVSRLFPFEDAGNIFGSPPVLVPSIDAVGCQSATGDE